MFVVTGTETPATHTAKNQICDKLLRSILHNIINIYSGSHFFRFRLSYKIYRFKFQWDQTNLCGRNKSYFWTIILKLLLTIYDIFICCIFCDRNDEQMRLHEWVCLKSNYNNNFFRFSLFSYNKIVNFIIRSYFHYFAICIHYFMY